ncbi:MAG: glycosyltransferase family 4 protein [Bacteroidales bacterium]|nr:glycosyltransferase family 4 protein [Bacteroidales bacterium]
MKINIYFSFTDKPFGGGNQFLKALRNYFKKIIVYEERPENADIILFNSHHNVSELIKLKRKYPQKIFIHRIDGPVFLIRNDNRVLDKLIYSFNDKIADASIFQSEWSKKKNYELGIKKKQFETIILNAPDSEIFNKKGKLKFKSDGKTKIIATSWASNINKGFETYAFLDKNLDFSKYEMTFCGNSPIKFQNIKQIKPLPSKELAKILKEHDIFITASKNDPCSNALIEAMHCGLPAIGLNDGGHPQIIGKGGLTFNDNNEIIEKIKIITDNYVDFRNNIKLPNMNETGQKYFEFMRKVYEKNKTGKKLNVLDSMLLQKSILTNKIVKHLKK